MIEFEITDDWVMGIYKNDGFQYSTLYPKETEPDEVIVSFENEAYEAYQRSLNRNNMNNG